MLRPASRIALLVIAVALAASFEATHAPSVRAATSLTVTTASDLATPCTASAYSLRCALAQANADLAGDTIAFQIPSNAAGCRAGVCTIQPTKPLPTLTASNTTINGYTQPGAHANTNAMTAGINTVIRIRLDGARVGTGHVGLNVTGSNNVIEGLSITGFLCKTFAGYCTTNGINGSMGTNGVGIYIAGGKSSGLVVQGNFIGLTPDGKSAAGNSLGINVDGPGMSKATIGGTTLAAVNLISGNKGDGVDLVASGNTVAGNLIGTTATANAALANTGFGAADLGGGSNTIGGKAPGTRNIISGNGGGVEIVSPIGDLVQGNFIGTNAAGTAAVGNNTGVGVFYSNGLNTIASNLISGNSGPGISISSASGALIQGNLIGTDVSGTAGLGNGYNGVSISSQSSNNVIGGTSPGTGNVISGNVDDGIAIGNLYHATGNVIEGNRIGVTAAGAALPNTGNGISFDTNWAISTSDSGVAVGGNVAGASNVIANNGLSGVMAGSTGAGSGGRIAISRNSILNNGGLGIDLAPQGTVNCTTTGSGPNDYLFCPVIQTAGTASVTGTACGGCTVEVFVASAASDDLGHGEGATFLGSTSAGVSGAWTLALSAGQVTAGQAVTATATNPAVTGRPAETSEFGANVVVGP